jgi:bifunctional non-homologous end joining protein LigD
MAHASWQIDGRPLAVTHLDRLEWPEVGVTKGDVLRYYQAVTPVILPYCRDRPVTLRVFPAGAYGPSFYQRDRPERAPSWLRSTPYQPESVSRTLDLLQVDDAAELLWLVNTGAIEFHLWASRLPDIAQPDEAIFDLDPGSDATFADVLRAALRLQEALERAGVSGCPKTSGGRGRHVIAPLVAGYTFDAV